MRRYLILESRPSGRPDTMRSGSRSQDAGRAGFRAGARPPAATIRTEDLSDADVGDARRDPRLTLAPVMATTLIRPLGASSDADADVGDAWGLAAVGADASPCSGKGCVVAVLDTGIQADHPAFAGMDLVSRDFSGDGDGDRFGHGTHCAGTIFGRDVDGRRIGIARGVSRALVGKVLGDDGGGTSEMIFAGLQWAIEQNADIVSMSLGLDFPGQVATLTGDGWPPDLATSVALEAYRGNLRLFDRWMDLLKAQAAFRRIPLVIAAAGNESRRDLKANHRIGASLPAAANGVISVGALRNEGDAGYGIAQFSNTLPTLCAPGVDILSADLGGGLRLDSGTSMAGPHVAGVAALWFEALSARGFAVRPEDVEAQLRARASTDRLPKGVEFEDCGLGLVSAPSPPP